MCFFKPPPLPKPLAIADPSAGIQQAEAEKARRRTQYGFASAIQGGDGRAGSLGGKLLLGQ
jgi:hypothetical protein